MLYRPRAGTAAELDAQHFRGPDLAHAVGRTRTRDPYTDPSLVRAMREGVVPGGSPLGGLMPRYTLSDAAGGIGALALGAWVDGELEYRGKCGTGFSAHGAGPCAVGR